MNRLEWRKLAERWLEDAKTLLDNKRWSAAYYLAGYAVECGLKACVLARVGTTPEVVFEDKKFSENCWKHDPKTLLRQANLDTVRDSDARSNLDLGNNWQVVEDWKETARYEDRSEDMANKLYAAITDTPNGVMQWVKARW